VLTQPEYAPHFTLKDGFARPDMDWLRQNFRLLVGAPAFGGNVTSYYHQSYCKLKEACLREGIVCDEFQPVNESDIHRGRNLIAAGFYHATQYTDLLFWDVDEDVSFEHILMMKACNLSIVGGLIPLKGIDWDRIAKIVNRQDRKFTGDELSVLGNNYAINPEPQAEQMNGCLSRTHIGTGLMLIQRRVVECLVASGNHDWYDNLPAQFPFKKAWQLFPGTVVNHQIMSEDYSFCHAWGKLGGRTWCYPHGSFGHWGGYLFRGQPVSKIVV